MERTGNTVMVSTRMDEGLVRWLRDTAQAERRSVSQQLILFVEEAKARREAQPAAGGSAARSVGE